MEHANKIILFQEKQVRRLLEEDEWYFNLVDIIEILTESPEPRKYWSRLKRKIEHTDGGNQMSPIWRQLKFQATDKKFYQMDAANTQGVLRILMSVPSPKAEPFRLWLAEVGKERIEEIENPELGFERLKEIYKAKGYSEEWIKQRVTTIDIRKQLTDEWKNRGVKDGQEYAILTAEIAKATFGLSPSEHAKLKGLDKQNLRDNMTNLELIFTALGEELTRDEAVRKDAQGFEENHEAAHKGGTMAGDARKMIEKKRGEKVVSPQNFLHLKDGDKMENLPENIEIQHPDINKTEGVE
jgi:DNA-damage-inducible protein D